MPYEQEPFQKDICMCFIDYSKASDCVNQKLWTTLQSMGKPEQPHAQTDREATVQTRQGK